MAGLQVEERAKYGQVFETLRPVDGRLHGDKVRPVSFPDRDFSCIVYFLAYSHTHTHPRLTALFPGLPGSAGTRKVKPIWIFY